MLCGPENSSKHLIPRGFKKSRVDLECEKVPKLNTYSILLKATLGVSICTAMTYVSDVHMKLFLLILF